MTNYVPKGAGRAAHKAKTDKHAQRTPLPPKGATTSVGKSSTAKVIKESVEEGKSKMVAAKSRGRKVRTSDPGTQGLVDMFGGLAAPAAKAPAKRARKAAPSTAPAAEAAPAPAKRGANLRTSSSTTAAEKGAVSAPLKRAAGKKAAPAAKKASPSTSKARKAAPAQETAGKAAKATSVHPSAPSGTKAEALAEFARSVGWSAEVEKHGAQETVLCEREPEKVLVHFADNKLDLAMMPTHEFGARVVKLRNVSAAKKVMEMSPEDAAKAQPEAGPRRERKERGRLESAEGEEGAAILRKRLPWPDGDAPDDAELLATVVGRRIVWLNTTAGTYEEAHVLPTPVEKQRHLKVVLAPNGKRTLNFASVEGGFRSVYVENIWQVR